MEVISRDSIIAPRHDKSLN